MKEETRKKREAKRQEGEKIIDQLRALKGCVSFFRKNGRPYFNLACRFAKDQHERAMNEVAQSLSKDHPLFGFALLFCPAVTDKLRYCIPSSTEIDDYLAWLESEIDALLKCGPLAGELQSRFKELSEAFWSPDCDQVSDCATAYRARIKTRNTGLDF